ncbi:MAG: PcfJ family protein [Massilimaliae sp.]|nr:PcfJ family protein [Massiliimalia sp.]
MRINKRACRKYADPGIRLNLNSGILHTANVRYVITTAVKNVSGCRLLILSFLPREEAVHGNFLPRYTVFQAKQEYISLERREDGTLRWREARLEVMEVWPHSILLESAFYTAKDEARVLHFCGQDKGSGLRALQDLQAKLREQSYQKRKKKRERAILHRMAPVRNLPKGLERWTWQEILPAYLFYEYQKNRKAQEGYCTACRQTMPVPEARHQKHGICPNCGHAVTYRALGRGTNLWDQETVQIIQRAGSELLIRVCKAVISYRDYRNPSFHLWESARSFVSVTDTGTLHEEAYYYSPYRGILTHWIPGFRPHFFLSGHFEADPCGYLYPDNLKQVLAGTPWQYSQLSGFAQETRAPLEVVPYLSAYLRYPVLEYLVKLKLYHLAADVIYRPDCRGKLNLHGRNPREVLQIDHACLSILQEAGTGVSGLQLLRGARENGIHISASFLHWVEDNQITQQDDIISCLRYMSEQKLIRYITEQYGQLKNTVVPIGYRRYETPDRVFSEYKDYLRFCRDLGYDLKNSFVLFPRNLQDAHDKTMTLLDKRKAEIYDRKIQAAFPQLDQQYAFQKSGLMIVVPQRAQDITDEGHALHHCVGSYIPRVADGKSVILFLRKEEEPDKPYYTMELIDGRVTQIRGQNNCGPDPSATNFLRFWEAERTRLLKQAA